MFGKKNKIVFSALLSVFVENVYECVNTDEKHDHFLLINVNIDHACATCDRPTDQPAQDK